MTIPVGITIAIVGIAIYAVYSVTQVMLDVAFLRAYLEAKQHERRDPDSAPCVGDS